MSLLRSHLAPAPATLVSIFQDTVARCGEEPAIDNGATVLTYEEFAEAAGQVAEQLADFDIGPNDRVGVRIQSGTVDLYVAIMGVLMAGACYVPVDADDPDERAQTVFAEANVAAVIGSRLEITQMKAGSGALEPEQQPGLDDDAWVIFTSGSTGTPKGVAVTHRSAAAFVDAESRIFLTADPIGPGDRVMAGLSVAFDASCEEMWLAWAHGACLVPAPRSLVRSGLDLGPWLVANRLTIVSTVPTLVLMWPVEALASVRLLILGGEACPPEIGSRFANDEREVWNTYGPTEATVVSCAAQVHPDEPVRIGMPLDGWDLAVVDESGQRVADGETGELIIAGVGLARYLDPAKDAEKYAPMPDLGWDRAYRSGDVVSFDGTGLVFAGRADDQVKVGGRRIELGEIDNHLLALDGVTAAAAAVRTTSAGNQMLVGYIAVDNTFDQSAVLASLRQTMPAALVPRLAIIEEFPTKTSGKVDRNALPWPLPKTGDRDDSGFIGTAAWLAGLWLDILGASPESFDDDFFDLGGGSLSAAQLVAAIRHKHADMTVADLYEHPTLAAQTKLLDDMGTASSMLNSSVAPVPKKTQAGQLAATVFLRWITAARWLTWIGLGNNVARNLWDIDWLVQVPWWPLVIGWIVLITPFGRMGLAAAGARVILAGITPGVYPRGGKVHLRVWLAERFTEEVGAMNVTSAPWMGLYARLLGAQVGKDVDFHAVPPVTGMMSLGRGAAVELEADVRGYWIDGSWFHLGRVDIAKNARIGTRSMLLPGANVGKDAEVEAGSAVFGDVGAGERWSGAPAVKIGKARGPWEPQRPATHWWWTVLYGLSALIVAGLPVGAVAVGFAVAAPALSDATSLSDGFLTALLWLPLSVLAGFLVLCLVIIVLVRLLGIGLAGGHYRLHGRVAWQVWTTLRVLDEARTWLFPLYASTVTPWWLRALGASIGKNVEASTVLLLPSLTRVDDGAFLADDTLLGAYELGGGWLRIERVRVGKNAFVGNSGMAAPGRRVPKRGLVAVLSAAPRRTKAKAGTSWLGSPPTKMRRDVAGADDSRTFNPPRRLRVARALVEVARLAATIAHVALALLVVLAFELLLRCGWWVGLAAGSLVFVAAGTVAAWLSVAVKWFCVGRIRVTQFPLWSSFVWRNELADTFLEVVAAPWFARHVTGTPLLNWWFEAMGASIGKGVWCETYWLPEADLIDLRDGATVNQGCVVQTHLFHERMLSMDKVTIGAGGTLGPNSVILPAAVLGKHATVGPMSLVMRGEAVPDKTRWIGNPIGPWHDASDEDRR